MGDIFSGLEGMGFGGLSGVKIYDEEKKASSEENKENDAQPKVVQEEDFLFDKKMQCPVCDKEFRAKTVKTGKARLIGSDSDFRPKYAGIDSIKYDAIVCPNCGYAALSRFFGYMTSAQAKLIKENVTANFRKLPETGTTYTYDEAINHHKLALLNAIVKKAKVSERAYTCLKLAWLYRGKKELLAADAKANAALMAECEKNEKEMIKNAYEGFIISHQKEDFPICGMDESTFEYLLADLAVKNGNYDVAIRLTSGIIVSRTANAKLKEKARTLRDAIKNKVSK